MTDEFEITDYVPDQIEGYDEAMLGCHYVFREEHSEELVPVIIYSGPLLTQIAVETEGISWEDALEWSSSVAYTGEFRIIVMWEYIEIDFEPEVKRPHLEIVH
jgi:hypothetical protein